MNLTDEERAWLRGIVTGQIEVVIYGAKGEEVFRGPAHIEDARDDFFRLAPISWTNETDGAYVLGEVSIEGGEHRATFTPAWDSRLAVPGAEVSLYLACHLHSPNNLLIAPIISRVPA